MRDRYAATPTPRAEIIEEAPTQHTIVARAHQCQWMLGPDEPCRPTSGGKQLANLILHEWWHPLSGSAE